MNYLKNYTEYLKENVAFDQIGPGTKLTYRKKDGIGTKEVHRIDYQNELVFFLDKDGKEFSKTLDDIVSAE